MSGRERMVRIAATAGFPLLAWHGSPGQVSFWPLLLICLVPLFFWIAESASIGQAAVRALVAGICFQVLQLYWIVSVLTTFGGLIWILAVAALLLLSCYMGLYLALVAVFFFLLNRSRSLILLLVGVPAIWVGLDWLRSWLFGGFPWMDLGYGLWTVPLFLQTADLAGHYGATFLLVTINSAVFLFFSSSFSSMQKVSGGVAAFLLLAAAVSYSHFRTAAIQERLNRLETKAVSRVGIVQGNVEQEKKWEKAGRKKVLADYLQLSRKLADGEGVQLVVWPETALPFSPSNSSLLLPVRMLAAEQQMAVLTGAPWYEIRDWEKRDIDHFNSAVLLDRNGIISGRYNKTHLVPYGEYVPLQDYMPFLAPLVQAAGDFTPGVVEKPLVVDQMNLGVLICYESIFGTISREWVENGANLLVNLTNDAWYGKSSAPYQSWAMTVFRSVETRRSLVRSANTGISGVIDPLGRVVMQTGLFVPWSGAAPVVLMEEKTFYVRGGWRFAPLCLPAALFCMLAALWRYRRHENGC